MSKTKWTPGAMRAATKIVQHGAVSQVQNIPKNHDYTALTYQFAEIIDRETAGPELLKSLREIISLVHDYRPGREQPNRRGFDEIKKVALAAITKAEKE